MTQNITPNALIEPDTEEKQNLASYLKKQRQDVEDKAIEAIEWYIRRKRIGSFGSRILRVMAILLTFIGGISPLLPPLLQTIGFLEIPKEQAGEIAFAMAQFGYIAFAIAATCMALDKFMGLSSSWMRYITTSFALQKALAEFQTDWILMWSEVKNDIPTDEQQKKILHRIKEFRLQILTEMEQETQMWTNEFQSNLAQLQMSTKAKLESEQPGIIDLTVSNAARAEHGLNVMIDSLTVAHMTGTQLQIGHVAHGQRKVTVHGIVDGKDVQVSRIINVTSNAMMELKLSLPIADK